MLSLSRSLRLYQLLKNKILRCMKMLEQRCSCNAENRDQRIGGRSLCAHFFIFKDGLETPQNSGKPARERLNSLHNSNTKWYWIHSLPPQELTHTRRVPDGFSRLIQIKLFYPCQHLLFCEFFWTTFICSYKPWGQWNKLHFEQRSNSLHHSNHVFAVLHVSSFCLAKLRAIASH